MSRTVRCRLPSPLRSSSTQYTLVPGSEFVLDTIALDERLEGCDLVLTGEGRLDAQTRSGKAPLAVALRAAARGVPTIAVVGAVAPGADESPFARVISLAERFGEHRALTDTAAALTAVAEDLLR